MNPEDNIEIIDLDNMGDIFDDAEQPVVEEGVDDELWTFFCFAFKYLSIPL